MTGLAALRVGRNAPLSDISVLGSTHIATGYLQNVPPDEVCKRQEQESLRQARCAIGDMYQTTRHNATANVKKWSGQFGHSPTRARPVDMHLFTTSTLNESGKVANQCPTCNEALCLSDCGRVPKICL